MDVDIAESIEFKSFLAARHCFESGGKSKLTLEDIIHGLKFFLPFSLRLRNNKTKNLPIDNYGSITALVLDIKIEPIINNKTKQQGGVLWMLSLYDNYFYMDAKSLIYDMVLDFNQTQSSIENYINFEKIVESGILHELVYTSNKGLNTLYDLLMQKQQLPQIANFPWPIMSSEGITQIRSKFDLLLKKSTNEHDFLYTMVKWSINPYMENSGLSNYKCWRLHLSVINNNEQIVDNINSIGISESANNTVRRSLRLNNQPSQDLIQDSMDCSIDTTKSMNAESVTPKKKRTVGSKSKQNWATKTKSKTTTTIVPTKPYIGIVWKDSGLVVVFEDMYGNTCNYIHPLFMHLVRTEVPSILPNFKNLQYDEDSGLTDVETDEIRQSLLRTFDYAPRISGQLWVNLKLLIPIILNCPSKLSMPYNYETYNKASENLLRRIKVNLRNKSMENDVKYGIYNVKSIAAHGHEIPTDAVLIWTTINNNSDYLIRRVSNPKKSESKK